jgi:hypothetical protein
MVRNADADRYRADVHVAVIDVPAIGTLGVAAAGEGGHAPHQSAVGILRQSP